MHYIIIDIKVMHSLIMSCMMLQLSCSLLNRLRKTCSNKKILTNQFVQDNLNKAYTNECRNQIC